MRRLAPLLAAIAIVLAFAVATTATASTAARYPLVVGEKGERVRDAQHLLRGLEPAVRKGAYFKVRKADPTGEFGKPTASQVRLLRYRLGEPMVRRGYCPGKVWGGFTKRLRAILMGRRAVPRCWKVNAIRRRDAWVKAEKAKRDTYAARIAKLALSETAKGCREIPDGSNYNGYGGCIHRYQSVTRAFRAAWCVSTVQWLYVHVGLGVFANATAGVDYAVGYARARGWLRSFPKPGYIVAWPSTGRSFQGHMGVVVRVLRNGIATVEGNAGNALRHREYTSIDRPRVYIAVPGVENPVLHGPR